MSITKSLASIQFPLFWQSTLGSVWARYSQFRSYFQQVIKGYAEPTLTSYFQQVIKGYAEPHYSQIEPEQIWKHPKLTLIQGFFGLILLLAILY
jgi:hypothetical protein